MSDRDLFGDRARDYARTRPTYPESLFDHLGQLVDRHDLAWDCGAGSGQASRSLARRFSRVIAADSSLRQLSQMDPERRIERVVAAAESAPLRDACADLVTVSAALHWFDRPRFYAEVRRVARPGAILAVWSYFHARITPEVDAVMVRFGDEIVGPLWPRSFALNRHAYQNLDLPFDALPWPGYEAEARMRLADLTAFMSTWSASQAWARRHGTDPVDTVRDDLAHAWGDPEAERVVRWPLHGAIARVSSAVLA